MKDKREVLVNTTTLELLTHTVHKREITEALLWAAANRDLLIAKFHEFNPNMRRAK